MKREELKKLISQIRKYDLATVFTTTEEFDDWLSSLNSKQINNFNNINVEVSEILFPVSLLINKDLLKCDDYIERIEVMLKLKNCDGCWHLFERLCSPNFLNSKNYYKDMEMISKADDARYALSIINNDVFINSPYHNEDLKLLVETHDVKKEHPSDFMVSESLAMVASNIDSINSPYHQEDMKIIATAGSDCLYFCNAWPKRGLNNLAVNEYSLADKYHLENMKLLAKNPVSSEYLYYLMTTPYIIKGKNYRSEVDALFNAKSEITALATYLFIENPSKDNPYDIRSFDFPRELYQYGINYQDESLIDRNSCVPGRFNPKYLECLTLLNKIEDKFVMFFGAFLANNYLLKSNHLENDLDLLLSIKDKDIFMDLYKLMTNEASLFGVHHRSDAKLISSTVDKKVRNLLLSKAINKESIKSNNHEYDMQYITKLDLNNIDEEHFRKMYYYLFSPDGINHIEHIDELERLYRGEPIENSNKILEHLNYLEQNLEVAEGIKIKKRKK